MWPGLAARAANGLRGPTRWYAVYWYAKTAYTTKADGPASASLIAGRIRRGSRILPGGGYQRTTRRDCSPLLAYFCYSVDLNLMPPRADPTAIECQPCTLAATMAQRPWGAEKSAQKSLGSWLRETVRLPGKAVEVLIPKLIAKQVCELRHLKILREAGGLEALFLDRPSEMQAVSAALDQLYPPAFPGIAAYAPPEPAEPFQPLQPARMVTAAPATTNWRPPPADAPAVFAALVGADGSQAPPPPPPQSMGVPGGIVTGSPSRAPPAPSTTQVKTPNSSPNTLGYARDFGMEHPYAMAAAAAAAAAAATAAAHAAAVKAALPPASVAPGVQPPTALAPASVAPGVRPTGDAVRTLGLPPSAPAAGHTSSPPGLPAPPGPPGPPVVPLVPLVRGAAAAMAQAGAAAVAASAAASAAMVQSPAQRPAPPPVPPASAPRMPPPRPPPFPPATVPIQVRAAAAAADARREAGLPPQPFARRESGPPQQPQPALPESPPQQPTRSPTEPLCGFVPYQLSAEMYANIYRNPAAFGYPEVASGTVARPKFGYIFVETRSATGRRPKLLDGLDWIPSSATNAKHKLLRDGKTELVRQYCTRRTKSDAAKAAATAWGHFVREVVDTVKAEHPGKTSYEIKAITGDRWRALPENDPIKVRAKAAAADANRFHRQRLARADPAQLHVESTLLLDPQFAAPALWGGRVAAALPHYTRLHSLSHTTAGPAARPARDVAAAGGARRQPVGGVGRAALRVGPPPGPCIARGG